MYRLEYALFLGVPAAQFPARDRDAAAGVDDLISDAYGVGEPLRYAMIDSNPVVYSLGGDEFDDGGKKEWDLKTEGSGDMTFRLETIEELHERRMAP